MPLSRRHARINRKTCVACGTCETVCPRQAVRVMRGCWAEVRADVCVGCGKCAASCPANSIEVVEREQTPAP